MKAPNSENTQGKREVFKTKHFIIGVEYVGTTISAWTVNIKGKEKVFKVINNEQKKAFVKLEEFIEKTILKTLKGKV